VSGDGAAVKSACGGWFQRRNGSQEQIDEADPRHLLPSSVRRRFQQRFNDFAELSRDELQPVLFDYLAECEGRTA
jgi:hypothetical protein